MKPTFFMKTTLLALSVALFAPLASASSLFDINISGSDAAGDHFSVTLVAKADPNAADTYDILGGFGVVTRVPPVLRSRSILQPASSLAHGTSITWRIRRPVFTIMTISSTAVRAMQTAIRSTFLASCSSLRAAKK